MRSKIPEQKNKFMIRDFNKINYDELFASASQLDWTDFFANDSIDHKLNGFYDFYKYCFESFVPLVRVKINYNSKSWFSRDLSIAIKHRNRLYKLYRYFKLQGNFDLSLRYHEEFSSINKQIKSNINKVKKNNFTLRLAQAKSSKKKWDVLKSTGCSNERKKIDLNHNFNINELNDHYVSIHSSSLSSLPLVPKSNITFSFNPIIPVDVISTIKLIKSQAVGYDGISIKFLKIILPYFLEALVHLFNFSINNGEFPHLLNNVIVKPIEKRNNPSGPADTRPIVINNVLTKIFTSILDRQIRNFLNENHILSSFQSGFRSGHSCTSALMRVSEDIRTNIANNKLTIMILLDIKSAYPSVNHSLLLHILESIGFDISSREWIKSFLKNKAQYVRVDNDTSNPRNINCGLLQGDNLSQTFFSIIINNIVKCVHHCKIHLYADDVAIYLDFDLQDIDHSI